MPRQRLGLPHTWATTLGQKLMIVPALALIYCGAVVLALGAGVAPADVDAISSYQAVHDALGGLDPAEWSQTVTIAVAVAGLLGAIILMALGWAQRLVPHVTRSAIVLRDEPDGTTTVAPRAVERAVELAARHTGVRAAKATLGEADVQLALHARRADLLPDALRHAKTEAVAALDRAGLPDIDDVRVTVTRFTPASRKDLLS